MELTLPIVHVTADNLAEGWERAVVATWQWGAQIATEYDRPGDPPSRDATLVLAVRDGFAEPRLHRCFPGGLDELEAYRQEVVHGLHDHWVDPAAGKWEYTYHERLTAYRVPGVVGPINQLDYVVESLARSPHTRRALAITWQPWQDAGIADPACLQLMWFRIFDKELVLNVHMRSNDAFRAAFMNMYAFTELQRVIATRVSERLGRQIRPGQYNHIADSFHIYGSYFADFEGFLKTLETRTFEQRTWRTEEVADLLEEARQRVAESVERERLTGRKGL